MAREQINTAEWAEVAAKAQAFQALHVAGLKDKSLTERATFLMALGLGRPDTAALLGTSDDALRVTLARQAKKGAESAAKPAADIA